MADVELVIKIPEEVKQAFNRAESNDLKGGYYDHGGVISKAIKNGTPLPKRHGRLIDADWVKNTLDIYVLNEYNGQFIRRNDIDSIPTIIEADTESEDVE